MLESDLSRSYRDDRVTVPAWLLLEWLQDPARKPAMLAFTEGPARQIAYAFERAIAEVGDANSQRYMALRATLEGGMTSTIAPLIIAPESELSVQAKTYTRQGLDDVCDSLLSIRR